MTTSPLPYLPNTEIARRIRAARSYAGLSIADLADKTGLGATTLKRIEADRRNARRYEIWAIAEACSMPRGFFEVNLTEFCESAERASALLARVEKRLAQFDARSAVTNGRPPPDRPSKASLG